MNSFACCNKIFTKFIAGEKIMAFSYPNPDAYKFLDDFRGKDFNGTWPTVVEMFEISCKRFGSRPCFKAFHPKELSLTYNEVRDYVLQISNYLLATGVKKGDKIAVSGKNSPEWAVAYLAILYAGATVVPLDITYNDNDMETLMAFGDVSRIFIDADRIENIGTKTGKVSLVEKYCLEENSKSYPYLFNLKAEGSYKPEVASEDDVAAILFTSGTTGVPKGVQLTHKNLVSDCYEAQVLMKLYPEDVFYAILPLHHAYTMLAVFFETISCGASCVFGKRLIVPQVLKELKLGKVTMFLAVPLLFNKLLSALMNGVRKKGIIVYGLIRGMMGVSGFLKKAFHIKVGKKWFGFLLRQLSLENTRICICGGGPLPPSTFKMFNELGIDFVQGYGLTETSPITHLNPVEAYNEASVGHFIPAVEVKIVNPDEDGNGLIYVKGSVVMKGYYKNEEATRDVLSEDGWLNTGDVGYEKDGYLFLTGRSKNVIVTEGGKNVFPEEIEDHFQLHYDVDQICVCGYIINAKEKSEGIAAIIYPSADCVKSHERDLEDYINSIVTTVNKELQSYKKITKVIVSKEPLAMTSTKKVKRFEVEKLFKKELNKD